MNLNKHFSTLLLNCSLDIINSSVPLSLRLAGILAGGVAVVFSRQVQYLHDDSIEISRRVAGMEARARLEMLLDTKRSVRKSTVLADPEAEPTSLEEDPFLLLPTQTPHITAAEEFFDVPSLADYSRIGSQPEELFEVDLPLDNPPPSPAPRGTNSWDRSYGAAAAFHDHDQDFDAQLDPVPGIEDVFAVDPFETEPDRWGDDGPPPGLDEDGDALRVDDPDRGPARKEARRNALPHVRLTVSVSTTIAPRDYREWVFDRTAILAAARDTIGSARAASGATGKRRRPALYDSGIAATWREIFGEGAATAFDAEALFPEPDMPQKRRRGRGTVPAPAGPGAPHVDRVVDGAAEADPYPGAEDPIDPVFGDDAPLPGDFDEFPGRSASRGIEVERLREALAVPDQIVSQRLGIAAPGSGLVSGSTREQSSRQDSGRSSPLPARRTPGERLRSRSAHDALGPELDAELGGELGGPEVGAEILGGGGLRLGSSSQSGPWSAGLSQFELHEETGGLSSTQGSEGAGATLISRTTLALASLFRAKWEERMDAGEEPEVSATAFCEGLRRDEAARFFYQVCVCRTVRLVATTQDTPYGDIRLRPGPRTL